MFFKKAAQIYELIYEVHNIVYHIFMYFCVAVGRFIMNTKILSQLQNSCSRREYCSREIRQKIETAFKKTGDFSDSDVEEVLSSLQKDGFFDDRRYAAAFVRDKSAINGWGPVKISSALAAKGVEREVADEAIRENAFSSRSGERLRKLLEAKYKTLSDDPQKELKLIRFALGRGYTYEQVKSIVLSIRRQP